MKRRNKVTINRVASQVQLTWDEAERRPATTKFRMRRQVDLVGRRWVRLDVVGFRRETVSVIFQHSQSILYSSACVDVNHTDFQRR